MPSKQTLSTWAWRDSVDQTLSGETEIPSNIHLDLLAAKLIPDPFIGQNEADLQWIHGKTWVYTTSFETIAAGQDERMDLVFDGLDTFATVKLNGQEILRCDNMFLSHRVDVRHLILPGSNELEIVFDSAYNISEELRAQRGHRLCWNGHYGRVYVRKAQYHFGWDWGPSFVTCGPWKPAYLERYSYRIDEITVDVNVQESLSDATVTVNIATDPRGLSHSTEIELIDPRGLVVSRQTAESTLPSFDIVGPELWYPHTHGKQPLYQIKATLRSASGDVVDTKVQNFGIRRIELIQAPVNEGSSFYFTCNGIPIFMGGSNWIPGDSFLPRMTADRYKRWIDLAVRGNQNMIRVWGGGIYEDDAFYDECDRRGLLVWQDFAFACGQYPADGEFLRSVKEEAVQAIKRLRSHPSLAIWAGNNEDYQVANEGLNHDMTMPEEKWAQSTFSARIIYERILPDIVKQHSPKAIYWPGSPFGGVDNNTDRTAGDAHIWDVSGGMLLPYQRYPDLSARFVSEFGMLSCPSMTTITESFFGDSQDFSPQSKDFEFHIRANAYEKRMFTCMGESVRISFELEKYAYLSQLVQSEAMYYAFRGWRRLFEGRECGGTLAWQMNDVWPVVSRAIVDYYERPKMAYYAIARAMRSVTTGISRKMRFIPKPNEQHDALCNGRTRADAAGIITHSTPHIYPPRESTYQVWVANATTEAMNLMVRICFVSIKSGLETRSPIEKNVEAKATGTTEVASGETPEEEPTVVISEIFDSAGCLLSYDVDWPQPLKHLTFPDRNLKVEMRGEERIVVSAARPVKGLFFTNDGVDWSDNALDIVPGREVTVLAKGLKGRPAWMYYGMD